ncbi:Alkaline-phosphatase-like, core domain [Pseudocohnilembus persalinus]|uniref:Alkaline-phosphatase-like, core domain n=1 Tax=Pseudocohnilembus persalinus TaxID=266149 RepID=A0A0V0QY07_PSEPJ|nr:Alkaline-phosphatase-like, core domain [Pseudocohnilembus persalinus]|eukprot:KRX07241.1 Alkaline-phosphatase-like, core domain [Pseudocohnilembus persalinus]
MQYICGPLLLLLMYCIFEFGMLKGCGEVTGEDLCVEQILMKNMSKLINRAFIISILLFTFIYLVIKNKISRYYLIPFFIGSIYLFGIKYDISLKKQSYGNIVGGIFYFFIACALGVAVIHSIIRYFYKLYKKNKKKFCIVLMATLVFYLCFITYLKSSCRGWDNGIAGHIVDDLEEECTLLRPYICWHKLIDGWFLFEKSCEIEDFQKQKLKIFQLYGKVDSNVLDDEQINAILNQYNYMSYPLTSKFDEEQKKLDSPTQQSIIQETIFTKDYNEAKKDDREVIVNLNNMEVNFEMQRNKTLVNERNQVYKQSDHLAKNVILIYIDTLARAQAHRKLPKTMEFLSQYSDYDPKNKEYTKERNQQAKLYEFFRFHSIDRKTRNNIFKLQYNVTRDKYYQFEKYKEPMPNLLQEFKKRGYVTGHSTNTCTSDCAFRYEFIAFKKYFIEASADHEFLLYDPQYIDPNNYYNFAQGINSIYRRCIFNTDTAEHVFNYGKKFLSTYQQDPKFLFMEFTDSHEATSEVVTYMDDHIVNFLESIKNMGYLEKETNIILLSDHGQHIVSSFIYQDQNTDDSPTNSFYAIERMLPLYMIIMTQDILNKHKDLDKNLMENQQKFISMQQVRNTIVSNAVEYQNKLCFEDSVYAKREESLQCHNLGFAGVSTIKYCVCKNPDIEDAKAHYNVDEQILKEIEEYEKNKDYMPGSKYYRGDSDSDSQQKN